MSDRDTDMRYDETWKLETRAKTKHTSVETEPRPRHKRTMSRDSTRVTPSLTETQQQLQLQIFPWKTILKSKNVILKWLCVFTL